MGEFLNKFAKTRSQGSTLLRHISASDKSWMKTKWAYLGDHFDGTKCGGYLILRIFLATFATSSTEFQVLAYWRHYIPATFKSALPRDIQYPRLFLPATSSFLIEKNLLLIGRIGIYDICDIKYPRLLNLYDFAKLSTRDFWNFFFSRHFIPVTISTEITRFKSRFSRHYVLATFSTIKGVDTFDES